MSSEVAIPTATSPAVETEQPGDVVPFGAHTSPLVLWAYEARQARLIAQSLARTSFVPASLRGKPDDITAAILAGQELGLQPMATLRSIDVIQGTPALRAHAMRALVQSHGHKMLLVESTPDKCVMRGRRKDDSDDEWQTISWDLRRADQLGLLGKSEWKKQPQTMLVARATGELARLIAADVLHAMPYNAEELRDSDDSEATQAKVTAAEILGTVPPRRPTPVAVASEVVDAEAVPTTSLDEIRALFEAVEILTAEDRAIYVRDIVGREVVGLGDLNEAETDTLLAALRRFAEQIQPGGES